MYSCKTTSKGLFTWESTRRGNQKFTNMLFIKLATGAYKEHTKLLPPAAPCRFPCEQALRHKYKGKETLRNYTERQ